MTDSLSELTVPADLWMRIHGELDPSGTPADRPSKSWSLRDLFPRPWIPVTGAAGILAVFLVVSSLDQPHPLESDFTSFIQRREQQADRTRNAVFDRSTFDRYQPDRNPFIQPVRLDENPFRSDVR